MPRASKTGIRGLYGNARDGFTIDLRWKDPTTGARLRHRENLPEGSPAAAAKARAREILSSALAGTFDPKRKAPMRLSDAWKRYAEWCDLHIPASASARKGHARAILEIVGDVHLDGLTALHAQKVKRTLLERWTEKHPDHDRDIDGEPPVNGTCNRHLASLKHMVDLASREWGEMSREGAHAIRDVPKLRERGGRERYLGDEEGRRLWAAIGDRIRALAVGAVLTGMRQGELRRLTWTAVERGRRQITVRRTKSGKIKHVAITPALAGLLDAQRSAFPDAEHVFPDPVTGKAFTKDQVTHAFVRATERAGIEDLHFHDLRHTFASMLVQAGKPIYAVAAALGHSSVKMSERYSHLAPGNLQDAASAAYVPGLDPVAQPLPEVTDLAARRAARSAAGGDGDA